MNHTRCIERTAASRERRSSRHDVIDQDDLTPRGACMCDERAFDIPRPLESWQRRLMRRVLPAREQRRRELQPEPPATAPAEQRGHVVSALDQPRQVQRDGHHQRIARGTHHRQQRTQAPRQVGALTELQTADRRRQRRGIGASHRGAERDVPWRWRTRPARCAKQLSLAHRRITRSAVVGRHDPQKCSPRSIEPAPSVRIRHPSLSITERRDCSRTGEMRPHPRHRITAFVRAGLD
jgi:hypothetical protein